MALRLTGIQSAPSGPSQPAELAAQAGALLSAGDVDGYRRLFKAAAEHEDTHRRYHARVLLVEQGLSATSSVTPKLAADIFVAVAQGAVDALEQEPCEPILLNYAGVALYELWSLEAARSLFVAAQRLDPSLPHLRRNLKEVSRRLRARRDRRGRLGGIEPLMPALARRAKDIASSAKPATGLRLSLCMIVRDEQEMLPLCLAAAALAVDEIIIVDTGSTDRTVEIARSFGATVLEREWTGSFSEARNASFDAATGDWLLYLDADEVLVEQDVDRLRALTGHTWREAFYLVETSYTGEAGDGTGLTHNALRVFRNRPGYRFEGRIHEQIAHRLPTYAPGRIEQTSVRVEHYGYLGAVRDAKEKSRRNIELLQAQRAEGASTPFLHFNLGTEHAMIGDARSAVVELERAWMLAKDRGELDRDFVPMLALRLVSCATFAGRAEQAVARSEEALELFPEFTDLVYAKATALQSLGRQEEAAAAWRQCLEMGDAGPRYGGTVGTGTYLPTIALARIALENARVEEARSLLDRCISEHPRFFGVVSPYTTALLRSGMTPDDAVAEVERRVDALTPTVRYMLATALHGAGAMTAAEQQYRAVLAARPASSQVRAALAETLLRPGGYLEAAELTRAIVDEDPFAALACRIELWATIAAGELSNVEAASARATRVGLSPAELEVFTRWASLTAGSRPGGTLPVAGTPLLGVILETLLSVHEFDTFELLVGLLHGSDLPPREQRELLASMYLRHGFLASAAQEWMAVCQEQPDARAMLGLARVAAAHGLPEEAGTFAAQAVALDPTSNPAREFLALHPVSG
jgi:tetratricopeptide (TPR) repeat protein